MASDAKDSWSVKLSSLRVNLSFVNLYFKFSVSECVFLVFPGPISKMVPVDFMLIGQQYGYKLCHRGCVSEFMFGLSLLQFYFQTETLAGSVSQLESVDKIVILYLKSKTLLSELYFVKMSDMV